MANNKTKIANLSRKVVKMRIEYIALRYELGGLKSGESRRGVKRADTFAHRLRREITTINTPFTARQIADKVNGDKASISRVRETRLALKEAMEQGIVIRTAQNSFDSRNSGRLIYMRIK